MELLRMVFTREATQLDGSVLQQIMTNASQGSDGLRLTLITVPDFFGRARLYESAETFVAEADGALAGSAAYTVREQRIGGRVRRVGYEFQYFTSPDHRRMGAAARLRERIEQALIESGAEWTTAVSADSNTASIALFERYGFARHGNPTLNFVFATQHTDVRPGMGIRPAGVGDLGEIANLLRTTWAGYDFVPDWEPETLEGSLRRVQGPDMEGLLVREERGRIVACVAIWNWAAVQQITVNEISPELQPRFPTFQAGKSLRHWGLREIGFRDPEDAAPLLRHVANHALSRGIDQIGMLDVPGIPDVGSIFGLPVATIPLRWHVKPLVAGLEPAEGPAYVDIIDV
jgi:GNAT superfamily N-acetyltransferase